MKLLLLLLLALPARAQEEGAAVFPLPLFKDGLHTRNSANVIPDGALAEALNVVLDEDVDGVVVARRGYAKYNTTALTDSKSVRGLWKFDATTGTRYFVAFSSQSFFKSTGDGLWTQINSSTFSTTKEFDCVQALGKLWCANGDTVFTWDGTSTATVTAAPLGDKIDTFRNRILIAGIGGQGARLRLSGELDGTDWTLLIPGVSTSPSNISVGGVDDGLTIRCLMGAFQDVYLIGKLDSLWGLYGFGRGDFQIRELSREVGCLENSSVQEKNNCLYWLSKRGVEKYCGNSIERASDPIRDQIDNIVATAGNDVTITDTSLDNFQAGNLTASGAGAPMTASYFPGSVTPSSFTVMHHSTANFNTSGASLDRVKVSTAGIMPDVFFDDFNDNDMSSSPAWTQSGYINNSDGTMRFSLNGGPATQIYTASIGSTGTWTFRFLTGGPGNFYFFPTVQIDTNLPAVTNGYPPLNQGYYLGLVCQHATNKYAEIGSIGATGLMTAISSASLSALTVCNNAENIIQFKRNSSGEMYFLVNGSTLTSATDTTYTSFPYSAFFSTGNNGSNTAILENLLKPLPIHLENFTYTSREFDTAISTPIWGYIDWSHNTPAGSTLTFQTHVAPSVGGTYSSYADEVDGTGKPAVDRVYQYKLKWEVDLTTIALNGIVPQVYGVQPLEAKTTGYFISRCFETSSVSEWGIFSCNQTADNGSLSFAISTAASCNAAISPTGVWNTQINNTAVSIDTGAALAYRVLFDVDMPTETPKLLDCSLTFEVGATRPPVATAVHRDAFYLAYTSSTASDAVNDQILRLDRNDKWTTFSNHSCYSLGSYNRKVYCGSSTAAGQVWLLDQGTDDDGEAITSRIRTKAFNFGMPEARKKYRKIYLDLEPSPDPAQTISLTGRYTLERSTPTYSLGSIDLNEDPGSIMTSKMPFPLTGPISGRYIQIELESSGLNNPWRLFGGRLYFSPLDPE